VRSPDRSARVLFWSGLGGVAIAAYLTVAHYADAPLVCIEGALVDCGAVTASSFSLVPGTSVPVAAAGLGWSLGSVALAALALGERAPAWVPGAHFAWAAAALAGVLYLVYAEIVVIGRICEWCTLWHVVVLVTFVVALRRLQEA